MNRTLTDRFVAGVKPARTTLAYPDTVVRGFALRVMPSGTKSWIVRYKQRGRSKRVTFADASQTTLAEARVQARDLLGKVSKGADPATEKREAAHKVATVHDLAVKYIAEYAKPKKRSWKGDDNLLRRKVLPRWRHRELPSITRQDVQALVKAVAVHAPVVANRVVSLLSKMFAFALDQGLVANNPAVRITKPKKEKGRERVLTEDEIRTLWPQFDALAPVMAATYKLRLLTLQRPNEIINMEWPELDLATNWWTIPGAKTKNGLAHRVPLTPSVLAILKALEPKEQRLTSDPAVYVFAGARGDRQQSEAAATFALPDFRPYDLRRTGASLLTGNGIPRLTVQKILNHAEREITAVYDRHSYDAEKAAALAWWDARLTAILEHASTTVVLPFSKPAK